MLAQLLAEPGVVETCVLSDEAAGRFGFMALHGGLEDMTAEIASAAATRSGASLYRVTQPGELRWHIPSREYAAGISDALDAFCAHVDLVVSVHGYGGLRESDSRWTTVLLGGGNRALAAELRTRLDHSLPHYHWLADVERIPSNLRGLHPDNPVNRPPGRGVQMELPPRVRGNGPFWAEWRQRHGEGLPPHTEALVEVLAATAASTTRS